MHEHANKSILKYSSFKSNWTHLVSMIIYLFDGLGVAWAIVRQPTVLVSLMHGTILSAL